MANRCRTSFNIHDHSFLEPYRIAIDCHDKYAYVCNSGSPARSSTVGTVSIISIKSNKVVGIITGFDGPGGIAISNKNQTYVSNYGALGGAPSGNS